MLIIKTWQQLAEFEKKAYLARPINNNQIESVVKKMIDAVKMKGDAAVLNYTKQFDCETVTTLSVQQSEIDKATITLEALNAIKIAIKTITTYHKAMLPESKMVTTVPGIDIERVYRPIDKVGLYIPGGNNTPLISSLLMQAIPAKLAGCPIRLLCTPPNSEGKIDPHMLVAARLCDIDTIFSVGGAQAIAAMAYGTETIPKVDKIFGPGNTYVTEAKTQVSIDPLGAAIDLPAGPSEVMIVADDLANPAYIAADLLAQAEHGIDSQVLLLCESHICAERVNQEVVKQLQVLSRKNIILESLQYSKIFICANRAEMLEIINQYAPEHLIINRLDANTWISEIKNAGTIFIGPWSAETMGDYVNGSNHVLPTSGYARTHSGLSCNDFLKAISIQTVSIEGIKTLGETAYTLAMLEGLDAHANAVKQRLLRAQDECN